MKSSRRWLSQLSSKLTTRRYITVLNERALLRNAPLAYRVVFAVITITLTVTSLIMAVRANEALLVEVPTSGGSLTEGIIGTPRFINPLLAVSNADKTLTSLVYAGLMTPAPDGTLVPELAQGYSVSDNGTTYTFTLRDDITFHDGHPITAEDVAFTVRQAQDATLKSPQQSNWSGVEVDVVDDTTVRFTLEQAYAPFIYNTTIGILPKHIWQDISADEFSFSTYNVEAIGSGPYRIDDIKRADSGTPESFRLTPFRNYARGKPYIREIIIETFLDERSLVEALNKGAIDSAPSISPQLLSDINDAPLTITTSPLPRVFGTFFNQNQHEAFANEQVRTAFKYATDKQAIIDAVFAGHAAPLVGPLPPSPMTPPEATATHATATDLRASFSRAEALLKSAGWEMNEETGVREKDGTPLSFTLSTSNTEELKRTAQLLNSQWERVGASVDVQFYEPTDLKQNIIRPREFETLLFGQVLGYGFDLYPYWHSSQRSDPGLNIAQFTDVNTDAALEEARRNADSAQRRDLLASVHETITKTTPAIFLFSPQFIYVRPETIKNADIGYVSSPAERFLNVHRWYIETERVWPPFVE